MIVSQLLISIPCPVDSSCKLLCSLSQLMKTSIPGMRKRLGWLDWLPLAAGGTPVKCHKSSFSVSIHLNVWNDTGTALLLLITSFPQTSLNHFRTMCLASIMLLTVSGVSHTRDTALTPASEYNKICIHSHRDTFETHRHTHRLRPSAWTLQQNQLLQMLTWQMSWKTSEWCTKGRHVLEEKSLGTVMFIQSCWS